MWREASTVSIFASAHITKISDINIAEQSFSAEIEYSLKWKATKEEFNKWRYKLMFPIFKPNISVSNTKEIDIIYTTQRNKYFGEENIRFGCINDNNHDDEHWVIHNFTVKATFYKEYNLANFPFDCHDLSIHLNVGIIPLTWDDHKPCEQFKIYPAEKQCVSLSQSMYLNTQWTLYPEPIIQFKSSYKAINESTIKLILNGYIRESMADNYRIDDVVSICDNFLGSIDDIICIEDINETPTNDQHFTSMDIRIKISRKYAYYIYYLLLIYLIITFLSMISLFLNTLCEQILYCILLILSMIIIQFNISISLKTMSWITFLDKYCFGCIGFIIFTNIIDSKYYQHDNNKNIYLDIIQLIIMFILFNFYFFIYGVICYEKERKIVSMKGNDLDRDRNNNHYSYYK